VAVDCLLDTNILIRFLVPRDPLSPIAQEAVRRLTQRGDRPLVATQNLVESWVVATRPLSANGLGLTVPQASHELAQIESLFPVIHETRESLPIWRDLVTRCGVSGRQAHDARLAAVMLANDVTHILTFNGNDFARYPGVTVVEPSEVAAGQSE